MVKRIGIALMIGWLTISGMSVVQMIAPSIAAADDGGGDERAPNPPIDEWLR
jgi:hypothetical protein